MLKIDLLPAHYTIARRNRKVIFFSLPLLGGVIVLWLLVLVQMDRTIAATQAEYEQTKAEADRVRKIQEETQKRQAELKPIKDKVDFVKAADESGKQFWERFFEINKYIYERAVVTRFSITPPTSVAFDVEVQTTEDAGRFLLNIIRCPAITSISISGQPASGGTIAGVSGATAAPQAGPGGPGMPGAEMGPGMPGGPGMGPGMPGGPPGMPGAPGGPGGAGAPGPQAGGGVGKGPIRLSVTAQLVNPITIPQPPGAAPAGGGMMGGPGMMPGGPGGPEMGGPGGPPGGPGGPPGGPAGPGPGAGPKGRGGEEGEGGGGGGLRRRGADVGDT